MIKKYSIKEILDNDYPIGLSVMHQFRRLHDLLLITLLEILDNDYPIGLSVIDHGGGEIDAFWGHCPCGTIFGNDFIVNIFCWRVTGNGIEVEFKGDISKEDKIKIFNHLKSSCWIDYGWKLI